MDLKEIKAILRLLKGTDIVEFELEGKDGKIRIKRGIIVQQPANEKLSMEVGIPPGGSTIRKEEIKGKNLITITSPMVGTFYRSPSHDAPAFVEEGSIVKKGQPICIIEAMKIMNEIEAESDGKVVSILVDNGQPVEYGEPLFLLEPM